MPFEKIRLVEPLRHALAAKGYTAPTPIQEKSIPPILEGRDVLGCAQTGTGKTAAFALPILQRLLESTAAADRKAAAAAKEAQEAGLDVTPALEHDGQERKKGKGKRKSHRTRRRDKRGPRRVIRALILSPTRELAAQIGDSFRDYGQNTHLKHTVVFGGVSQRPQCTALQRGVDILVATPGRLLDLMEQGVVNLEHVEIFVLDEADRMLDMGFIVDIRKVIAVVPTPRQTLLFSATVPKEIKSLANSLLHDPVTIKVKAESAAADTVDQCVYHVEPKSKIKLLQQLLENPDFDRTLVFSRTKRGADKIVKRLSQAGIPAEAIHSDKSQAARTKALENFKRGKTWLLVASDIAARGLDVDQISHVINYDMPNDVETYVHRIGRTGRAGQQGHAITFCTEDNLRTLKDIEKMLRRPLREVANSFEPLERGNNKKRPKADHPMNRKKKSKNASKKKFGKKPGGRPGGGRSGAGKPTSQGAKKAGKPGGGAGFKKKKSKSGKPGAKAGGKPGGRGAGKGGKPGGGKAANKPGKGVTSKKG